MPRRNRFAQAIPRRLHELKIYERIVNRMSDVGVANLATRQLSVSTAPGRGGSKPPAAAQPLDIQRTAQLRQLREAKSLPYRAYAFIRVLAKNRGCGRILSAPTERVLFILLYVLKSNLSY